MANEHVPIEGVDGVELFGAHPHGPLPHGAHMPDLGNIRSLLDELRNTRPRFEQDDERLPDRDTSTNDEILDGVWKLYRTHMERNGAPHHYPTFNELQQYITTNRANIANALGITSGRLDQIDVNEVAIAKWILRKEDSVASLSGDTDSRRPELNQYAMTVLRNAGHNAEAENTIDPIARVKELELLNEGPVAGGKKSTHHKGKKSQRKGKKTQRKGKKSRRKTKKSRRKTKKTRRVN